MTPRCTPPETVDHGLELDDKRFCFVADDAAWSAVTGELISARINGNDVPAAALEAVFGPIKPLSASLLGDLMREAHEDAEADYGDAAMEARRDMQ